MTTASFVQHARPPPRPPSACRHPDVRAAQGPRHRVGHRAPLQRQRQRSDFDDGWGTLDQAAQEEQQAPGTQVIEEHARGILAGNDSPDIGFDLSINPYRGCEHGCVYCYARPDAQLPEPVAGARFRDPHRRQGQRRRAPARSAVGARLHAAAAEHRLGDRRLPARRAPAAHHALGDRGAGRGAAPVFDHHQGQPGRTRHRPHRADGPRRAGRGLRVDHHARPRAGAGAGAARRRTAPPAAHHRGAGAGRHSGGRERVAGHPVPERTRARTHPGSRARSRCQPRLQHRAAPALGGESAVPALAASSMCPSAPRASWPACARCVAARTTTAASAPA